MKKNRFVFLAVLALMAAFTMNSCASFDWLSTKPPSSDVGGGGKESEPPTDGGIRELVLVEGEKFIDTPYQSPPRVPGNFDCSGFVSYLFDKHTDIDLPTASSAYVNVGEVIEMKDAQPGDLLIFTSSPGGKQINHVAILYKKHEESELRGSLLLHAISIPTKSATIKGDPNTTGVKISEMGKRGDGKWQDEYFLSRFHSVRRVIR